MLDIHTVVPFRILRAAAPHLREPAKKEKEEGKEVFRKIVNISSISGTMGNAGQANYSAGKAAVVGLTKTLAKEWGQFKINVNAVAFGFVETRLTAAKESGNTMTKDGEEIQLGIPEQMRAMAAMIIPIGRPGHAGGGRRPGVLPLLTVGRLRARPGAERDRRPVRRDVLLASRGDRRARVRTGLVRVPASRRTPACPSAARAWTAGAAGTCPTSPRARRSSVLPSAFSTAPGCGPCGRPDGCSVMKPTSTPLRAA